MISASNIPFWPPKMRPMNISRSVSAVSRNAVLKVFPIKLAQRNRCYIPAARFMSRERRLRESCARNGSAVALDCPRKRLIQRSFGFGVFRIGNLALLVLEFQLEELFFEDVEQCSGPVGNRSCHSCDRRLGLAHRVESAGHQHPAESAKNRPAIFVERVGRIDGAAESAAWPVIGPGG